MVRPAAPRSPSSLGAGFIFWSYMLRCHFLIDGYNLYHSMDDAGKHPLKWLNLHRLAEIITAPLPEHSVKVYWFSAYAEWREAPYKDIDHMYLH